MEKKLEITAEEAIYLLCKESSLILDGKADIQGTEVKLEGLIKGPVFVPDLPPVPEPEDPPPPQLPPPPEKRKGFWDKMLDGVQVALDVVGMIPGVGEIADLTNAAIYTARGDYTNAALSAAAAIPFAGWAATGAKFVNKGAKALKAGAKYGDEALDVAKAVQKVGDAAATSFSKLSSSFGKVKTAARKIEEIKEQFNSIQKIKDTMKGMAANFTLGYGQELALAGGVDVAGNLFGDKFANALGMLMEVGGGGKKRRGGNGNSSGSGSSGGSGGSGSSKPPKDRAEGKSKDNGKSGPVIVKVSKNATHEQKEQAQKYVDGCNRAVKEGYISETGRVSTKGKLRQEASRAAKREKKKAEQNGQPYQGHPGHVPDTTWTNNPEPYEWLDPDPRINTSIGGQANGYPVGYKPTEFILEEIDDGANDKKGSSKKKK